MAIEKRISLTLDSSNVSKQIKTLRTELEGVQKAMPSSKSDPFAPMQKSASKGRKTLLDYTGSLTNFNRAILSSSSKLSALEKAALANDTALRKLRKANDEKIISDDQLSKAISEQVLRYREQKAAIADSANATKPAIKAITDYVGAIDNEERAILSSISAKSKAETATLKYDTSIRKIRKAYDEGELSSSAFQDALYREQKAYDDTVKKINTLDNAKSKSTKANDSLSASQKSRSKALIDYKGALENTDRILKQSVGTTSLVEKQTLKHDTALRRLNKAYEEGKLDLAQYNAGLATANTTNDVAIKRAQELDTQMRSAGTGGFKVMRGSLSQLSYQLQDIAVQAQMGTNAFIILGQQGPQIASLLGPMGAVIGVAIAIGAAVGGTALTAFLDMDDAAKTLNKQLDELDGSFERTEDGALRLSDAVYKLRDSSQAASTLDSVITALSTSDALKTLERSVRQSTNSVSQSFFGMIDDIDIEEYQKSLEIVNRATKENLAAASTEVSTYSVGAAGRFGILAEAASVVDDTLEEMSDSFGISTEGARNLASAINNIGGGQFAKEIRDIDTDAIRGSFDTLDTTIAQLFNTIEDGDKRKAFLEFAKQMRDAGEQGRELSDRIDAANKGPFSELSKVVNIGAYRMAVLDSAYNETSSTITALADEQARLNGLVREGVVSKDDGETFLSRNTVSIISESIAGLETYAERVEYINALRNQGVSITDKEAQAALALADVEDFVYKKRTENLASLINDTETLSDIFEQGAKDYSDSVGSYNESLQGLVSSTFSSMEDAIVSFAETGKLSFSDFATSVISDLLRIQVQQQLAGLATSIAGAFSASSAASSGSSEAFFSTANAAKGLAVTRYASGGVTGMANSIQSTPKYFANGGGLLGESAQSEAILPLTRTSGGDLGVKTSGGSSNLNVNVNINDQTGGQVQYEQQGTTQSADGSVTIDVVARMVNQVVSSGKADRAITGRFNTTKRGK